MRPLKHSGWMRVIISMTTPGHNLSRHDLAQDGVIDASGRSRFP